MTQKWSIELSGNPHLKKKKKSTFDLAMSLLGIYSKDTSPKLENTYVKGYAFSILHAVAQ